MPRNLALAALLLAGCIPPPAAGPGYAPQPGYETAAAEPSSESTGTTCVQIVQCLAGCGQDQACLPACIEQGDPASQEAIGALLECNAAGDVDCTPQLDACRSTDAAYAGGGAPTGGEVAPSTNTAMQPGQPHSTENLIPWLTGAWIGNNHQFEFYGDGRVRRSDGSGVTYGKANTTVHDRHCVSVVNDTGTLTQEGDLLIMRFEATDTNHCGEKTHTAGVTVRYRIDWVENHYDNDPGLQLVLRDIDCTNGPMWCDDAMTRR